MIHLHIILVGLLTFSWTNDKIDWKRNLGKSKEASKKNGKTIIVYFGASWCGPCRIMERDLFSKSEFIDYSKKFEMVKIWDDDKDEEKDKAAYFKIMQEYNISSIPSIIVINNGKVTCTIESFFREPNLLIKKLNTCK